MCLAHPHDVTKTSKAQESTKKEAQLDITQPPLWKQCHLHFLFIFFFIYISSLFILLLSFFLFQLCISSFSTSFFVLQFLLLHHQFFHCGSISYLFQVFYFIFLKSFSSDYFSSSKSLHWILFKSLFLLLSFVLLLVVQESVLEICLKFFFFLKDTSLYHQCYSSNLSMSSPCLFKIFYNMFFSQVFFKGFFLLTSPLPYFCT